MTRMMLVTLAGLVAATGIAVAQMPPGRGMGPGPGRCRAMMGDLSALDAKLDEKVAAMNAAQGEEKVAAMAAVLNEMVAQRKTIHAKMRDCPMAMP
jgi:ABC-type xylose transport system permease subunit